MKKLITLMMAFAITMSTFAQFGGSRKTRDRFNHSNVEQYYGLRLGYNIACINSSDALIDTESYGGLALGGIYGLQLANSTPHGWKQVFSTLRKAARTSITLHCRITISQGTKR